MNKRKIFELAEIISKREKIPPELTKAIIMTESSGDPFADSGYARGLMQISEIALKDLELPYSYNDMLDPSKNIEAGVKYLKRLYSFWVWQLARWHIPEQLLDALVYNSVIRSYNWGIGNVKEWYSNTKPDNAEIIKTISSETRDYLHKVDNWIIKFSKKEV